MGWNAFIILCASRCLLADAPLACLLAGVNPSVAQEVQPRLVLKGHSGSVYCVAFSPDGKTLASGGDDQRVLFWDVTIGRVKSVIDRGTKSPVTALAFSPDGKALATACPSLWGPSGGNVWDVATGRELCQFTGHKSSVSCLVFSPDSKTLASADEDGTVRLWDVAAGAKRLVLSGHTGTVSCVRFSVDGRSLASGSSEVKLWEVATGKERLTLPGRLGGVTSVAFSTDDKYLLWGEDCGPGREGAVVCWDLLAGREQQRLACAAGAAAVEFGEDKEMFVWVDRRGVATVSSAARGGQFAVFGQKGKQVAHAAIATGGRTFAIVRSGRYLSEEPGEVELWDIPKQLGQKAGK